MVSKLKAGIESGTTSATLPARRLLSPAVVSNLRK
jgi:hypothetical protein